MNSHALSVISSADARSDLPTQSSGEGTAEFWEGSDGVTTSGVRVTRRKALGYAGVWRAVTLIANSVGRLPVQVMKRVGEGKEPDRRHQAYRLLRKKPNQYMTAFTFKQALMSHALLDGNGYALIVRDKDGRPVELLPLNPTSTWPVRADGVLWYVARYQDGRKWVMTKLLSTDVIHIKNLSNDGLIGYPVVKTLRDTFGKAIAARDYGSRYFKSDGSPGVILQIPKGMTEAAITNLRNSWGAMHQGGENAHKPALLRDGVIATTVPRSAKDAQLFENMDYDAREIANVFGVPAHKLGDPSKTAYNSLESENQSMLDDTLDPWLINWEEELEDKLLLETEKQDDTHAIEFTRQALSRTNLTARGDYYTKAITTGWLSPDEVRGYENMNPIPDGSGKVFMRPLNTGQQSAQPAPTTPTEDQK